MSNSSEYISLSNSPVTSGNYRDGRNRQHFNRGFNQNPGQRFNGNRNNYSPYNRGYGQRSFNNAPRFEKSNDISAYYHPSMMQDPWKKLEYLLKKPAQTSLANDPHETSLKTETSSSSFNNSNASIS